MFDAHGEGRYAGFVHSDRLDVVGARARPMRVVQRTAKALGHAKQRAAVLVDGWLRSGMHSRSGTSCYILLVEPILVCGSQTIGRGSSEDRDVGPQSDWQLVLVRSRVGIHHSIWTPVAKSVLGRLTFPRGSSLLKVVLAGGWHAIYAWVGDALLHGDLGAGGYSKTSYFGIQEIARSGAVYVYDPFLSVPCMQTVSWLLEHGDVMGYIASTG